MEKEPLKNENVKAKEVSQKHSNIRNSLTAWLNIDHVRWSYNLGKNHHYN